MLTGHPPFPEGTLPQRIMMHQKQQAADVRKDRPDAPLDLLRICGKMMAKKPASRFQSAYDVAAILTKWLKIIGQDVEPLPPRESFMPSGESGQPLQDAASLAQRQSGGGGQGSGKLPATRTAIGLKTRPGQAQPGQGQPDGSGADTIAASDRSTMKGGMGLRGGGSGRIKSDEPEVVAPPIEAAGLQDLRDPLQVSIENGIAPETMESLPQSTIEQIKPRPASRPLHRYGKTPPWVWFAIGAGGVLAVILLIMLLSM